MKTNILGAALLPATLTAVCLSAAGCGTTTAARGPTDARISSPAPEAASAPSANPPTPVSAQASTSGCTTDQLTVSIGESDSAKFEESAPVRFTNVGRRSCTLYGWPGLVFRHDGQPMNITTKRDPGVPSTVVTLAPGQAAEARLIWHKYEGQGTTCTPLPTTLTVTPPGQSDARTVAWLSDPTSGSVCGDTVRVGAIAPPT